MRNEFEDIVKRTIESLPDDMLKKIENVEFIVLEQPLPHQLEQHKGQMLLGLYEGIPLSRRGPYYANTLPDRIYVFMLPILLASKLEGEDFREKIRKVVLHEIGHFFGLSEEEIREKGVY